MASLSKQVEEIQNPALGAVLLASYVRGYFDAHPTHASAPLPTLFIVLPILLHKETAEVVKGTQKGSGLRAFADKFSASSVAKSDLILSIQSRAYSMRDLTAESISIMLRTGLASIDVSTATMTPRDVPPGGEKGLSSSIKLLVRSSLKLGAWLSAVSLYEAGLTLKVVF